MNDRLDSLAWLAALREPRVALAWSLPQWERVLRVARRLRLLGRLGESLAAAGLLENLPAPVVRHLRSEMQFSRWRTTSTRWALDRIAKVLADAEYPRVLLKGAAYIAQGLPNGAGRLPSDLDILVPQTHVLDAQQRLEAAGWSEGEVDDHDRRYYHEWSHEVPPMRHPVHTLELDLHHNILPPVAKVHVDAALLLAHVRPSPWHGWWVLQPQDQVLHSAAHLFQDSEARERVRDLVDLDTLLRHFGAEPSFWPALAERAAELGLAEPLALACHFLRVWLQTPMPADSARHITALGPGPLRRAWLYPLWAALLAPGEPDFSPPWRQDAAAQLLLLRHHWNRMPLKLLLPHLWHKVRTARRSEDTPAALP